MKFNDKIRYEDLIEVIETIMVRGYPNSRYSDARFKKELLIKIQKLKVKK